MRTSEHDTALAVVAVAAGTGVFAVIFASGKFLGSGDLAWQIIFIRYVSAFAVLFFLWRLKPRRMVLVASQRLHLHGLRALCGGGGGAAAIYAAAEMPIADATAIGLTDVIFAVCLGVVLLGERLDRRKVTAALLCLLGAICVVFGRGAFEDAAIPGFLPVTVALLGAFLVAAEGVLIRVLAVNEDTFSVLFLVNLFGSIIFLIPALLTWELSSTAVKLSILGLGPLALVGQYLNIVGYRLADIMIVAPVGYIWVVYSAIIGWFVFDEPILKTTIIGSILIVFGGFIFVHTKATTPPKSVKNQSRPE